MYTDKSHIIVLLSVNSTGIGKLQQLVIGHSKRLGLSWLKHINEEFQNKNSQVLLLVDNASSHSLDDGIIKSFKAKYKHLYCSHVLRQFESGIDIENDTEIVEMVLEDAQIEGGANVDSDEDSEEPPPRLKKLMDL
ncbi:6406_t:CDS:2 [Entrophospora sp. SA101]|nr:6406_t:CDS:2 [Entrophospora sp. SA101]